MTINELLKPVAQDMQRVDEIIREHLSSEVALINQISAHIVGAGGKRMRPSLLLLVARALGAKGDEACRMAAIIEFIHTATLLHDDVVDETSRRRGRDTANALWGNDASVLVGDFLFARAFELMVETDSLSVLGRLSNASARITEGEIKQMTIAGVADTPAADYFDVIRNKTAILFAAAIAAGAEVAGADKAVIADARARTSAASTPATSTNSHPAPSGREGTAPAPRRARTTSTMRASRPSIAVAPCGSRAGTASAADAMSG